MSSTNTDDVSDLYASLPLPRESTCIRVLDVYGPFGSEDSQSPIHCDLRVMNFKSEICPPFAALSYVWGVEATEDDFIICRDCVVRVTPNCHSALRHLQKKLGNFTIWIDAICINQEDEKEKMNQISLMGDIYSKARSMYVWLGEGNAATNRAMVYLETPGYFSCFFPDERELEDELPEPQHWSAVWLAFRACFSLPTYFSSSSNHGLDRLLPTFNRLSSRKPPRTAYASYKDMNELLDREWMRRIWTYQEILLASNPIVVCGGYHIPWARFSLSITFLEYSGINYQDGIPRIAALNTWAHIASSRDYLRLHDTCFAENQSCRQKDLSYTTLQKYRKFIIGVSQSLRRLHILHTGVMYFTLMIFSTIIILWIVIRKSIGTKKLESTIPSSVINAATKASSDAVACAAACMSSEIAACSKACDAASSAASHVASLSADLANKITYQAIDGIFGPMFGVCCFAFFTSFILFLSYASRKRAMDRYIPPARNPEIDLVDGLCNRKSKEKKDKAIAVQTVLQRLSKTALPAIDNAQSLEHIYKQLCIHLMEVTGTIQFLLPASLNNFPEHPSWIPNWSAHFDSFWLKPTLFRNTNLTATIGSRVYWRLDPMNDNILAVRGRQICNVARCFEFQETLETYVCGERDIHQKNLRNILQCSAIFRKRDRTISSILERINAVDPPQRISGSQINAWKLFMKNVQNRSLETLMSDFKMRDSLRSTLETQILICNYLAKKGIVIFVTNQLHIEEPPLVKNLNAAGLVEKEGETYWKPRRIGIGSLNVRAGDSVMLIAGVSCPLILRRDNNSTRLVSPAIVQGVMEGQTWDTTWRAEDLEEFMLS